MLAKYDMTADEDKGLVATIKLPEGYSGGEFIMVPRCGPSSAGEASEDDGWLLGHVTDENTLKSYVLVCPPTFFVLQPKIGRRARATEGKQAWNLESATFTRMAQQHHHESLS